MENLSDRIKSLRLSANMTQEEFGNKFGIVKSTVSLYESGKSTPNDQIKKRICDYFHVSLDYLLGNDAHCSTWNGFFFFFFDDKTQEAFTDKLKSAIKDNDLSENDFKNEVSIGVEKATSLLEGKGEPTANDLIAISQFLDTSIDYLLGRTPESNKRERLLSDEEIILRYYHRFPEDVMELLESFCSLQERKDRGIVLGKCFELEKETSSVAADEPLKKTGTTNSVK